MDFKVALGGTFMTFPNDGPWSDYWEMEDILYIEGKRDSINQLVHHFTDDLSHAVASAGGLRIIPLSTIHDKDLSPEVVHYFCPGIQYAREDLPLESADQQVWASLGLEAEWPYHGVFIFVDGDWIHAFFPTSSDLTTLKTGLKIFGQRVGVDEQGRYPAPRYSRYSGYHPVELVQPEDDADVHFSSIDYEIMEEVKARVEQLRARGIGEYVIRQLFEKKRRVSRMVITRDFRIILTDYDNLEIKMEPLQKAVYILFLNHPEGLVFKHLPEHREELIRIYKAITHRSDLDAVMDSIDRVLDPTNNSINEKCSRIKAAFVSQFDDELAANYYITRSDGRSRDISPAAKYVLWYKTVTLDRDLLTMECDIDI